LLGARFTVVVDFREDALQRHELSLVPVASLVHRHDGAALFVDRLERAIALLGKNTSKRRE
jgi:hypothetical protein